MPLMYTTIKMRCLVICLILIASVLSSAPNISAAEINLPPKKVFVIPIHGMIEPALLYVIRRGVNEAESSKAEAIIFAMDTPGGTLDSANQIVALIQASKVPTCTFVEKEAFSAGAIIALATKEIYMAPGSVIGDAMPILMTPFGGVQEMSEDLQEKIVAAVCAKIRAAAEQGGHDKDLAEAMVRREKGYKIGDEVICPEGQLLTLTNEEAERRVGSDKHPLLSAGTVKNLDELLAIKGLEQAQITELKITQAERIARFVAGLAPVFLIIGLVGIYIEIKTPGFGLPGIIGILAIAIFFWGHHIAGLAGMEDITIFCIGVLLLLVEVLFIPGFGIIGILGIFLMMWGVLAAMIGHLPGGSWYPSWDQLGLPLYKLSLSLVIGIIVVCIIGRFLPKSRLFNKLVLTSATSRNKGFTASSSSHELLGAEGEALTMLRPAGTAIFGDRRVDVFTNGAYVPAGKKIRVVETHGSRIIVEPIEHNS